MAHEPKAIKTETPLRRALGLWVLTFYGLGMIIGAGIYVLVGKVAGEAGWGAPLAFLISALLASVTGLAYAELVGRIPEAAGEVAYAQRAFGMRWLSTATGIAIIAVAIAAAASIARGTAGYAAAIFPFAAALPDYAAGAVLIVVFTMVASAGVKQGAWLAAILSVLEVAGLLFVIGVGADALETLPDRLDDLFRLDAMMVGGILSGAFVAFFAYLGFENLANMAEETKNPGRTVAHAVILAIVISALLYTSVALVALLAVGPDKLAQSAAPLCLVVERAGLPCGQGFAILAVVALGNGILVEIMLVGRLLYGMARRGLLVSWFAKVSPRTRVPVRGTLFAGAGVLVLTMGIPFEWLVKATSGVLLCVFAVVNLSLWRLKKRDPIPATDRDVFLIPGFLPPLATVLCLGLLAVAIVGAF